MAAKEKGKIVSASPDSPTLEKLSTFSQQIRSALHCFSAVATRTNALWQSSLSVCNFEYRQVATRTNALWQSLKTPCFVNYLLVATRTNALWQRRLTCCGQTHRISSQPARMRCGKVCCRTARKRKFLSQPARMRCGKVWVLVDFLQAFLSQPARMRCGKGYSCWEMDCRGSVATRTNALWQRISLFEGVSLLYGRNPHECAVAKGDFARSVSRRDVATRTNALWQSDTYVLYYSHGKGSQPARMRCGKAVKHHGRVTVYSRNPHECAVAKPKVSKICFDEFVATRTNALWQRHTASNKYGLISRNPHECAVAKVYYV